MALFVPMMRFFLLPVFFIAVYFVCAKPVSASPGLITFQGAARASEFRPIFERLPLRPTAAQALHEVLNSGTGRVIRSWNSKNLIHTSHALKQSLSEHGLEVLFPLAEVFDGVADRDGPLRQEESVLLTGAVANIFDRFLFGHLSHEHLGKSVNKSLRVHSLKQAISRFLGGESLDNLFYEGQPGWDLYQFSVNALRDAKSYSDKDLNRLVPSRAVMKVGYCSQEIVLFAKALSLLGFGDFGEMTTLRARLKTRQIYIPSLAPFSFFVFGKSRDVYRDAFCFNDAMSEATRRFQETSSNGATGAMDFATATSLRSALVHWEDTIRVNMDRMRWIRKPDSGGMILVNVPAFELHAYENSREQLTMKVVVGDRLTSTPLFEDSMEYIIFRPLWWVPQSILQGELLAEVIKDPLYLQKYGFSAELNGKSISGYQVATLATRAGGRVPGLSMTQLPGPHNVLGNVKFIFPNSEKVYLHDTPDEQLFNRAKRAFSHGCIRVERPVDLVKYVLRDQHGWRDEEKIRHWMETQDNKRVNLQSPLPIAIVYWTVRTGVDGKLQLAEDIYGYDERDIAAFQSARR